MSSLKKKILTFSTYELLSLYSLLTNSYVTLSEHKKTGKHEISIQHKNWTTVNTLWKVFPNIHLNLFKSQENNVSSAHSSTNMTTHRAKNELKQLKKIYQIWIKDPVKSNVNLDCKLWQWVWNILSPDCTPFDTYFVRKCCVFRNLL